MHPPRKSLGAAVAHAALPRAMASLGRPAEVVASTTRYASHTDQANHIFAVYNDFKAADKQIMRLDADYNFQFKPVSGLTK